MAPTDRVRASNLAYLCPRAEVLAARLQRVRESEVDPDLALIFAQGHGMHWTFQNKIMAPTGMLVGQWRCTRCATRHGGIDFKNRRATNEEFIPRPSRCTKCEGATKAPDPDPEVFEYEEAFFIDHEYGVQGHPDGFLCVPGRPGLGVLELKSIGMRSMDQVRSMPMLEHIVQVHAYLWFTGFQWAVVVYWCKDGKGFDSLIEHVVRRDEAVIENTKRLLRAMRRGLSGGLVPPRVCPSATEPAAKKCQMADTCFDDARWRSEEWGF